MSEEKPAKKLRQLPAKAKIVKEDGTTASTNMSASVAVRHHPGDYYKIICRYKRNCKRMTVNNEGLPVWKEVDEAEKNMLPPFIVPKNFIERGKKRFWGSIWCAEMNEKLHKAGKDNSLMIISMKKLDDDVTAEDGIEDKQEQIVSVITGA